MNAHKIYYPRLSRRIKALLADQLLLVFAGVLAITLLTHLPGDQTFKFLIMSALLISIEPLFISLTGASIGQHLYGLRVRREDQDAPIGLFASYARFVIKTFFGIMSLVFVQTTRKHQALHDLSCKSIVVLDKPEQLSAFEAQSERQPDNNAFKYPSILRRICFSFLYIFIVWIGLWFSFYLLVSSQCLMKHLCSNLDTVIALTISLMYWASPFVISFYVWNGRVIGCRKKPIISGLEM